MSGVTKRIYESYIRDVKSMWNTQLKSIINVLPQYYTEDDIINTIQHFYPHEWASVQEKYDYYTQKDRDIQKFKGTSRYKMQTPIEIFTSLGLYRKLTCASFHDKYINNYDNDFYYKSLKILKDKRYPKIKKIDEKIEKAKRKTQQVTPEYIDKMIGLYNRKKTSQKDKVYLILELQKYYNKKVIQFFFKVNDTEINMQLRQIAFFHLQSFNYHPRLRKQKYIYPHTKNKRRKDYLKKIYAYEKFHIEQTPQELEYRIENSNQEKIKYFDYFISHSSKDYEAVQNLIINENKNNKNIFCDWINDSDYLKRNLLCEATLRVIEYRLNQSNALIFVESENSINSIWCKYELNYFYELGKPIYIINKNEIEKNVFETKLIEDNWFKDPNYRDIISFKK